jgi:acyl-lipid omega-6 desaturase (Delta-12 desaturase)
MVYSIKVSYWLTLPLTVIAAGFLVRIFIIFHDCGHGSFFKSSRMNQIVGIIAGILVFTPYHKWHYAHKIHHQTVGNLDKRGKGDVMTLTVAEYKNLSASRRLSYRLYRNPIVLLLIAPFFIFTLLHRFPEKGRPFKENLYTHLTTLGIICIITLVSLLIGLKTFLMIEIPMFYVASIHGVWLFYVQHQFKWVSWERNETWDYKTIAMKGSSFFKFPKVLQWFTGNIGFHHIHHLSSQIPNYNLEKCYRENLIFQDIKPINFFTSLDSVRYRLWDEQKHKLVGFKEALS